MGEQREKAPLENNKIKLENPKGMSTDIGKYAIALAENATHINMNSTTTVHCNGVNHEATASILEKKPPLENKTLEDFKEEVAIKTGNNKGFKALERILSIDPIAIGYIISEAKDLFHEYQLQVRDDRISSLTKELEEVKGNNIDLTKCDFCNKDAIITICESCCDERL